MPPVGARACHGASPPSVVWHGPAIEELTETRLSTNRVLASERTKRPMRDSPPIRVRHLSG